MRWPWPVVLAIAIGACRPALPRTPEMAGQFAVAPTHAALPPYGGAVWSAPCTATLGIASTAERDARRAAMQTWFPGSTVELTPLGDRARVLYLPGRGPAPARRRDALTLGKHVIELAAPLFGVVPEVRNDEVAETPRAWLVDVELHTTEYTRAPGETAVALVARIDRATGDLLVGLVEDILPLLPACEHAPPPVDVARATAAVATLVAAPPGDAVVVDPHIRALAGGDPRTSRGAITVYLPHTRASVDLDAVTYAILGRRYPDGHDVFDPQGVRLDPPRDARRALGHALRRFHHQ